MSSEYTPTTEEVRERTVSDYRSPLTPAEFDRWLAAHDAEVRAAERERCAATAASAPYTTGNFETAVGRIATRIRALGEPDEQTTNHEIGRQDHE